MNLKYKHRITRRSKTAVRATPSKNNSSFVENHSWEEEEEEDWLSSTGESPSSGMSTGSRSVPFYLTVEIK